MTRISKLVQSLSADLKKYKAYYSDPIIKNQYVFTVAAESFLITANQIVDSIANIDADTPMTDILELYGYVQEFYSYAQEIHVASDLIVDIQSLFLPLVDVWLSRTDTRWVAWVKRAYELDAKSGFEPLSSPQILNSSSVLDLFTAFQSGFTFLSKFKFKDPMKRDQLQKTFIKVILIN